MFEMTFQLLDWVFVTFILLFLLTGIGAIIYITWTLAKAKKSIEKGIKQAIKEWTEKEKD